MDELNPNDRKDAFCGCHIPPQYMSHTTWMKVKFVAPSRNPNKGWTGFSFQYRFRQGKLEKGAAYSKLSCLNTFQKYNEEKKE